MKKIILILIFSLVFVPSSYAHSKNCKRKLRCQSKHCHSHHFKKYKKMARKYRKHNQCKRCYKKYHNHHRCNYKYKYIHKKEGYYPDYEYFHLSVGSHHGDDFAKVTFGTRF